MFEAHVAQPAQLRLYIQQLVRRVFSFNRKTDPVQKILMQLSRR